MEAFHLDKDGRVRPGVSTDGGSHFTGFATTPSKMEDAWLGPDPNGLRIGGCGDVAGLIHHLRNSSRKEVWVVYCLEDGQAIGVEMVGCGGDMARWQAREVLFRAFIRGIQRISVVSNELDRTFDPPEIDLEQRRMYQRAADLLGIAVDHQVFVGLKGFSELMRSGEIVAHDWSEASQGLKTPPEIAGIVERPDPENASFAATLQQQIRSADDAEAVARRILSPGDRVALAVLHTTRGDAITGIFPVGSGDRVDQESMRQAFAAGLRGACHRVLILAGGQGDEWERSVEEHLGPSFVALHRDTYLMPTMTVLVGPARRKVWGSLDSQVEPPPSEPHIWDRLR